MVNGQVATGADKTSLAQEEQDFFNQIPTEKEKAKMTKDSILALYGQAPTIGQFQTNFSAATVPANNHQYVPQVMPQNAGFGAIGAPLQFGNAFGMPGQPAVQQMGGVGGVPSGGFIPTIQQQGTFNAFAGHPQQQSVPGAYPVPAMQQFAQLPNTNFPPTSNPAAQPALNQQFGNLSLGNVWQ